MIYGLKFKNIFNRKVRKGLRKEVVTNYFFIQICFKSCNNFYKISNLFQKL